MLPKDVAQQLQNEPNAKFIDVREPNEYAFGHAVGAVLHPLSTFADTIAKGEIPKDVPVYIICNSGGRSEVACTMLKAQGYENMINVEGGTSAWHQAGLPMQKDS